MARKSARRSGSVARVINSESNVREDTRARVTMSIKALRYAPSLAARSLASADRKLDRCTP